MNATVRRRTTGLARFAHLGAYGAAYLLAALFTAVVVAVAGGHALAAFIGSGVVLFVAIAVSVWSQRVPS